MKTRWCIVEKTICAVIIGCAFGENLEKGRVIVKDVTFFRSFTTAWSIV
jgi:hypothetical protein